MRKRGTGSAGCPPRQRVGNAFMHGRAREWQARTFSTIGAACAALAIATGAAAAGAGQPRPSAPPFTTNAERCILPAAQAHQVNPYVLRAILKVESGLNPAAVGRNANGTVDRGISQINSIHFRELAAYGIPPEQLQDACVGTYVGAWHLARVVKRYGNTWEGIAHYHSATPAFNRRYQVLLWNELVRSGAIRELTPAAK